MRDLIVFLVFAAALPFCFTRPFFGLLVFSWLGYMRPQDLCWGFASTMRMSLFAGLALILGYFAREVGKRPFMRLDIRMGCALGVVFLTIVSTAFAERTDSHVVNGLIEFIKIVMIALITTGQVDSRQRLRVMVATIALCLGFFGFKGGMFGVLGGTSINRGPGGMMEDNNDFALALVMSLPMLYYLGTSEKNLLVKKFLFLTLVLTMFTIVLTHSRGGFLAMGTAFLVIVVRAGKIFRALMLVGVAAGLFFAFAPKSVYERYSTIQDAAQGEEDLSVAGRFRAWEIGIRMIQHSPLLGVGHKNFQDHYGRHAAVLYPGQEFFNHVAHNSYIQMWSETGTIAFVLFMVMMLSTFTTASRLRRSTRHRADLDWVRPYANMVEATTAGFMVGGFFLNRAHFDLIWHWMAIVTSLSFIVRRELASAPAEEPASNSTTVPTTAAPSREVEWRPAAAGSFHGTGFALPRWERRTT